MKHLALRIELHCVGLLIAAAWFCSSGVAAPADADTAQVARTDSAYVHWLEERSMLHQAQALARRYSGNPIQWQHSYGVPQPRAASARSSVWFTAYPASTISASPGASVLATLADERLWNAFQAIGIQAIHTSPMKRSGGVSGRAYTPSIDGNFDRISFDIDPSFGTEAQYKRLVEVARSHGAIVIGDVVPGHTGKGPDFRLAERAYADYPGLYHMVRIEPADWGLLPAVPAAQRFRESESCRRRCAAGQGLHRRHAGLEDLLRTGG